MISLLKYYDWKKFSILYEESWTPVAESLKAAMPKNNLTYNHYKLVVDRHKCCEEQKPCCNQVFWHKEVEEMRNKTRSKQISYLIFPFEHWLHVRNYLSMRRIRDNLGISQFLLFDYSSTRQLSPQELLRSICLMTALFLTRNKLSHISD